jgi:hypothetical protein
LANEEPEFHRLGGEIVAVSVDSPGRNEALRQRWGLPFPVVSDPGGSEWLIPLDSWNPAERGGIAWPVVVLYQPDGREVFRFRSRDAADRSPDDDLMRALTNLGLPPIAPGPVGRLADPIEDAEAFSVGTFGPFFRGLRSASRALGSRVTDDAARAEAAAMAAMAGRFLDAWQERSDSVERR